MHQKPVYRPGPVGHAGGAYDAPSPPSRLVSIDITIGIGADSMRVWERSPPRPKSGGDALKSPPQEFYVIVETVKCTVKI